MRSTSILALILLASLLAGPVLGAPEDDSRPTVQAAEILAKIERGEPVEYNGVIVVGDLNFLGTLAPGVTRAHTIDFDQSDYREYEEYRKVAEDLENTFYIIDYIIERSFQTFDGGVNRHTNHLNSSNLNSSINIANSEIRGRLSITNVAFQESVSFRNTKFSDTADFSDTQFNDRANFDSAQFSDTADFSGIQFNDRADFDSVQFNNTTGFQSAHFKDFAEFWRVQFNGPADFDSTQFSGDADFMGAVFSDRYAWFREAEFSGDADFRGAEFGGLDADFREAQFNGSASFWGAKFSGGNANFDGAVFSETTTFENSLFNHANLRLEDAKIYILRLSNANFKNESIISLNGTDYQRLYVHWNSIEDAVVYNGEVYLTLVKNFRNIEYFEDADSCYYQYRRERQSMRSWREVAKYIDILAWVSCGYGVRPGYALAWSLVLITLFGIAFWAGNAIYRSKTPYQENAHEGGEKRWSISSICCLPFKKISNILRRILGAPKILRKIPSTLLNVRPSTLRRLPGRILNASFVTDVSFKGALYFSTMVFVSQPPHDWRPKESWKYAVMLEDVLGWLLLALFLVTLGNVMIR